MTSLPPETGRRVIVRLSDVDQKLRLMVAEEIVKRGGLRGLDALQMMLAAQRPSPRTVLTVTPEKADRVLRERKRPLGETPKVWTW